MANPQAALDEDRVAIVATALDYIEGFYDGDVARMERSLHPELAKRIAYLDPSTERSRIAEMSALRLIQLTRGKQERPTPKADQQKDVTILDLFGSAASVKIVAASWIDYLHMTKFNGRWQIINVLWEMKPGQPFSAW
jgi:hypothetical protein